MFFDSNVLVWPVFSSVSLVCGSFIFFWAELVCTSFCVSVYVMVNLSEQVLSISIRFLYV